MAFPSGLRTDRRPRLAGAAVAILLLTLPVAARSQEAAASARNRTAPARSSAPAAAASAATAVPAPAPSVPPLSRDEKGDYRVGVDDLIRIEVFDDQKLSGEFRVAADGTIVFPLLGQIEASGQSLAEIKARITTMLDRDYIFNPKVAVSVKEFRSQKVKLLGSVGRPGIYFLEGPTRLFELLSRAEGVSRDLGEIRRGQAVRIVRPRPAGSGGTAMETIVADLHDLLVAGREEANVLVLAGDVVYVAQSEAIHVVGEVRRPGTFPYEAGMTVLKAVGLAGGATKKGTVKGAVVRRIREGKEVSIDVKGQDLLQPDDILEVPVSFW